LSGRESADQVHRRRSECGQSVQSASWVVWGRAQAIARAQSLTQGLPVEQVPRTRPYFNAGTIGSPTRRTAVGVNGDVAGRDPRCATGAPAIQSRRHP
jgi:hypothetical protein